MVKWTNFVFILQEISSLEAVKVIVLRRKIKSEKSSTFYQLETHQRLQVQCDVVGFVQSRDNALERVAEGVEVH